MFVGVYALIINHHHQPASRLNDIDAHFFALNIFMSKCSPKKLYRSGLKLDWTTMFLVAKKSRYGVNGPKTPYN